MNILSNEILDDDIRKDGEESSISSKELNKLIEVDEP